jgi:CHASE2 domain-containing sensor protein
MTTKKTTQPSGPLQRAVSIIKTATRPIVRKGWGHWLRFALLLIAGSYIGHELSDSPRFTDWRYWLYQKQVRWERRGPVYPRYTALVLLDDDDYWSDDYQARSKLKRDKLAALLDRLNAAGVNTVAFDVFMESPHPEKPDYEFPDYRAEDDIFFQALQRMCAAGRHVILATEYWPADHPNDTSDVDEAPSIYASRLSSAPCVSLGHVDFASDMRKVPGVMQMADGHFVDSLSLAITKVTDPIAYQSLVNNADRGFRFGQFLTPEDFATRDGRQFIFSGHELQTMSLNQLREELADRTVIVGGHYHFAAYHHGFEFIDMINSPGGVEPGAMLHANFVEAMRDPVSTFTPISDRAAEIFEWSLAMVLALVGALEVHAGWKWAGFVVSFLASVVVAYALLQNLGIFLDFFIPILIILLHTMTEAVLEMRHEIHHLKHQLHTHQKKVSEEHP